MIYTCTLNPSIDYMVQVPSFHLGSLNRAEQEAKYPGGKGINVSRVLKRLGTESIALGFLGGFTGKFVEDWLASEGIESRFVQVDGDTRINIKLNTGDETEINGAGPRITLSHLKELFLQLDNMNEDDLLVLAGSIPPSLPSNLYTEFAKKSMIRNIPFVIDTSGENLLEVLPYKPFLIKPNHHELGDFFHTLITNREEAIPYAKQLIERGAQNVIVSMAEKGSLLVTNEQVIFLDVPKGEAINTVGAGDSLVAGFLSEWTRNKDLIRSFKKGAASGSATAFSKELCKKELVEELEHQLTIMTIE
jgi:1-phosphofructokinase